MSALRQALADYLAMRRALGYTLVRSEKLLAQFLTYLEAQGEDHLTTKTALTWAMLPAGADRSWMSARLSVVRRFATHLRGIEPATEVPPCDLLPGRSCQATPYLYSQEDVIALMTATAALRTPHREATYRTLIGLLAVTGMRVGEAIGLDRDDFDAVGGGLTIRRGKSGKSRELALHPSTVAAVGNYLRRRDRPRRPPNTPALFVSPAGTRLLYVNVQNTFQKLVCRVGIAPRSAGCRPRLHDLRHAFAVRTLLDAYRDGGDPGRRLALLSTYLGHVDPGKTYWYLSAAPELLQLAGDRLERRIGGGA
ncbi:tyrosine-type recombinase/integrase [Mesorhizobium sp. ORM16]|uniref:tyrosine-type recombinase/integrase n=1 Tax=Mesorhizobium sp. ORM16 TaxID=3376989 RepID=UPI0038571979